MVKAWFRAPVYARQLIYCIYVPCALDAVAPKTDIYCIVANTDAFPVWCFDELLNEAIVDALSPLPLPGDPLVRSQFAIRAIPELDTTRKSAYCKRDPQHQFHHMPINMHRTNTRTPVDWEGS
jgi:hypothetical protein